MEKFGSGWGRRLQSRQVRNYYSRVNGHWISRRPDGSVVYVRRCVLGIPNDGAEIVTRRCVLKRIDSRCPICDRWGCEEGEWWHPAPHIGEYRNTRVHTRLPLWGIELECGGMDSYSRSLIAHHLTRWDYPITLRHDGSIPNDGAEIVTRPRSLDVHRGRWNAFFAALAARKTSLRSWDTNCCGMHVHYSRNGLSPLQIGRIVSLLSDRELVQLLGGRTTEFAKAAPKKGALSVAHPRKIEEYRGDRYRALNITSTTIEFRLFRGTLNPLRFFRNLDACEAIVAWALDGSVSLTQTTTVDFGRWISAQNRWLSLQILLGRRM